MKIFASATFAVVCLLAGASALVIKSPNKEIRLGSVKQCDGGPYYINLVSGNLPDVINIPGTIDFTMDIVNSHVLPMDLMTDLKLKKLHPYPLDVPCINGLGSCEYDGCKVLDKLCAYLPKDIPSCKCPMLAGTYSFNNVALKVPDLGSLMDKLMVGKYTGEIKFYGKSDPSLIVGCFDMDFEFTHNTSN